VISIKTDFKRLDRSLKKLGNADSAKARAMKRISRTVEATSKQYAPISPNKAQYESTLVGGKSEQSTFNHGNLTRSITSKSDKDKAVIFVPENSRAGRYAKIIHDGKGKTWKKRGVGTIAKGKQADAKYLDRAAENHEKRGDFGKIIDGEIKRHIRSKGF